MRVAAIGSDDLNFSRHEPNPRRPRARIPPSQTFDRAAGGGGGPTIAVTLRLDRRSPVRQSNGSTPRPPARLGAQPERHDARAVHYLSLSLSLVNRGPCTTWACCLRPGSRAATLTATNARCRRRRRRRRRRASGCFPETGQASKSTAARPGAGAAATPSRSR